MSESSITTIVARVEKCRPEPLVGDVLLHVFRKSRVAFGHLDHSPRSVLPKRCGRSVRDTLLCVAE